MHTVFMLENIKGREGLEHLHMDEKIILKWILKERCENMIWLINKVQRRATVDMVENCWVFCF